LAAFEVNLETGYEWMIRPGGASESRYCGGSFGRQDQQLYLLERLGIDEEVDL
jgi:hypothetical protein